MYLLLLVPVSWEQLGVKKILSCLTQWQLRNDNSKVYFNIKLLQSLVPEAAETEET